MPATNGGYTSRRARRKAELARATDALTQARAREAEQARRLRDTTARAAGTTDKLPRATRALVAFTAVVVLGVSLVIAVVVIGTQIGFYRSAMRVQLVDLSGLGLPFTLDLAAFTPIATEGVVWACTLMAVVLVLLNRPSGLWTRSMWAFACIAAVVNAWHAITGEGDLLGGVVKGGLSIAGPFVVHLFILWARHVRTGKTLAEARVDMAIRWRGFGRGVLVVLGVVADHLTHPRVAARAFSLWRLYRGATYGTAWRVAVAERRERSRARGARRVSGKGGRAVQAVQSPAGEGEQDEGGERSPDTAVHGEPAAVLPDYDTSLNDLFARLEEEMAAALDDEHGDRSPVLTCGERPTSAPEEPPAERAVNGAGEGCARPAESAARPGERPGERSGERGAAPVNDMPGSGVNGGERGAVNGDRAGEHEQQPVSNKDRIIAHYWRLVNAGTDVRAVKAAEVSRELSIPDGTVRRVWGECQKGKHPDPGGA